MAKSLIAFLLALACVPAAHAASFNDPTRPPAAFMPRDKSAAASGERVESDMASLALQSIMLSPTRKSAIINGETVILGQTIRGSRLVEVKETHVILLGPQGAQKLEITPSVHKAKPGSPLRQPQRNRPRIIEGDIR